MRWTVLIVLLLWGSPKAHAARRFGYTFCDRAGMCYLKAHDFDLKRPVRFQVLEMWRYDDRLRRWEMMALNTIEERIVKPKRRKVYSADSDSVVRRLTDVTGLLWVKWREDDVPFEDFLYSGMPCNDVHIGPERKGDQVAICVPGKDSAKAAYVPDPRIYCSVKRGR